MQENPEQAQPLQSRPKDEWDEAAEFFTRFVRVQLMKATGFGHHPEGMRLQMSDRVYQLKSNGTYPDGTPKRCSYVKVS